MQNKLPPFGIDALLQDGQLLNSLSQKKIGLITNQSALTKNYSPSASALFERIGHALKCILTPEHGWTGLIGEGIGISDGFDPHLGLPIFSLYGKSKKFIDFITESEINAIIIDLQDIGLSCFTYAATCAKFLEACAGIPLEIIICDRPNPLGPQLKGFPLNPHCRSFLGYLGTSFQHGQTMGQLLNNFNQSLEKEKFPLTILPCQQFHKPFHYPWIPPSPNLPSWESVLLYPALVLLEGINVSEGRGTTLPFTCIGAPGLNNYLFVDFLNSPTNLGIRARPISFTPKSGKLAAIECQGAHLLVEDPRQLDAFSLGVKIIHFLKENYADFKWTQIKSVSAELLSVSPDMEGKSVYFIDYLLGTTFLREALDRELPLPEILEALSSQNSNT